MTKKKVRSTASKPSNSPEKKIRRGCRYRESMNFKVTSDNYKLNLCLRMIDVICDTTQNNASDVLRDLMIYAVDEALEKKYGEQVRVSYGDSELGKMTLKELADTLYS